MAPVAILASWVGGNALALDDESIIDLDAYVVKAEREPGNLVLDDLEIQKIQAVDLEDLFANESNIAVGGGSAVSQKIYVRGFEDTMLNVTVDGAQQIGELYHHQARVQLEPDFIKTIELDAGAGAATNGAGALTGALRVTLKDAFDMLEEDQRFGVFLKGAYGINGENSYKSVGSAYGKLTDNIGIIATVSYKDGGDYEDGNGNVVTPTAYTQERGYAKLNGDYTDHEWTVSFESLHDFGTYYERPHMRGFSSAFVLSDHEMNRQTVTANHWFANGGEYLNMESTLYWTKSEYNNHRNSTGALYGEGSLESIGLDVRNSSTFQDHGITYGIDFRSDSSESAQQATPPPYWGSSEQSASVLGVYLQDNWDITESFQVSAGLRFDAYQHEVDSGIGAGASNDDTGISPNVSVSWQINDALSLRAAYSKAFRGITIREAFFSAIYVHRGDLKSEVADNVELGFAWEKNGFFIRGTVYEQNIENYVNAVWVGADVWGYWENMGDANVEGYEAEIGKYWKNMSISFGVWNAEPSFNEEALNDSDLGLGTSIGRTWLAKFNYTLPEQSVDFGANLRLVEEEPNFISATAPDKEGYVTTSVYANWKPLVDDSLTLSVAINNLFDKFYYDHATFGYNTRTESYVGFPAMGRELLFSASVKF